MCDLFNKGINKLIFDVKKINNKKIKVFILKIKIKLKH